MQKNLKARSPRELLSTNKTNKNPPPCEIDSETELLYSRIQELYQTLMSLYCTNDENLYVAVSNEMKKKNIIHVSELLQLLKQLAADTPKNGQSVAATNQKLKCFGTVTKHELKCFITVLQSLYQRKLIKHIEIIESSILEREKAIRSNTDYAEYFAITLAFQSSRPTSNLIEEYNTVFQSNSKLQYSGVQRTLYERLKKSENAIMEVYSNVYREKMQENVF